MKTTKTVGQIIKAQGWTEEKVKLFNQYKPEEDTLAMKILESVKKRHQEEEISKKIVLHHLKQLKAQMGKRKKHPMVGDYYGRGIEDCMEMIDKKIAKINK